MRLGILGLPQGGKTTLFEILVSNAPPRAPGARQDRSASCACRMSASTA
jgi:hypothetical protein